MSDEIHGRTVPEVISLGEMLRTIDTKPWSHVLYLAGRAPWNAASDCATFDPEETEEADDLPEQAKKLGLTHGLFVASAQDIVANAKSQREDLSVDDLVDAFNFYFRHDAFMEF